MNLTFAFDVQLNDQEDYISEGTQVKISDNPFHLTRYEGFTPVIITEAYSYNGNKLTITSYVEWFTCESFIELRN